MATPTSDTGRRSLVTPADVVDVFVYVTVLNLAAQWVPSIIAESFTMSLVTAVLLKVVLEIVLAAKNRVKARMSAASTRWETALGVVVLWLLLVGSKFVVLTLEDLLLGDAISLGGFLSVTGLILVLMLARLAVRRLIGGPRAAT